MAVTAFWQGFLCVLFLFLAGLADGPGVTAFLWLRPFGVNINLTIPLSFVLAVGLLFLGMHILVGPLCVPAVTAFLCKFATPSSR